MSYIVYIDLFRTVINWRKFITKRASEEDLRLRQTKQKDIIMQALYRIPGHPTAEILYAALKQEHPNLSLATVYRNLNQFANDGLVQKLEFPSEPARFDIHAHEHPHAICRECGKIFDVPADTLMPVTSYIAQVISEDLEFEVESLEIFASGLCAACKLEAKSYEQSNA